MPMNLFSSKEFLPTEKRSDEIIYNYHKDD